MLLSVLKPIKEIGVSALLNAAVSLPAISLNMAVLLEESSHDVIKSEVRELILSCKDDATCARGYDLVGHRDDKDEFVDIDDLIVKSKNENKKIAIEEKTEIEESIARNYETDFHPPMQGFVAASKSTVEKVTPFNKGDSQKNHKNDNVKKASPVTFVISNSTGKSDMIKSSSISNDIAVASKTIVNSVTDSTSDVIPDVQEIKLTSVSLEKQEFKIGEKIKLILNFNIEPLIKGLPSILFTIDGNERSFLISKQEGAQLEFEYTPTIIDFNLGNLSSHIMPDIRLLTINQDEENMISYNDQLLDGSIIAQKLDVNFAIPVKTYGMDKTLSEWTILSGLAENISDGLIIGPSNKASAYSGTTFLLNNTLTLDPNKEYIIVMKSNVVYGKSFGLHLHSIYGSSESGYYLNYRENGHFFVMEKDVNGVSSDLSEKVKFEEIIGKENELKLHIKGSQFSSYINNVHFFDVSDSSFTSGQIGLKKEGKTQVNVLELTVFDLGSI